MSDYRRGGTSLYYAQPIARGGKVMSTYEVLVEREATLDESLSDIETRRVRAIRVLIHPGFDDMQVVSLDREDATRLRDALDCALTETAGEEFAS